jgi:glycosyltransferase involved in cell wall biosynthesis
MHDAGVPTPEARVDVVIATWNAAAVLEDCLLSVLEQTLPVRIVVVDGGSRDGTVDILRRHAQRLAHWVSEPDGGVYDALNKGLRQARSDYVYILGSDDRLAGPHSLEHLLAGGQGADVIYGDVVVKAADGSTSLDRALPLSRFRHQMPFSHQAVLIRRELAQACGFGDSLASDYRHLLTLRLQGVRFQHVPGAVAVYALGGLSDRQAVASTWDRWRINRALRGWRALDVLPFYLAQAAVCWLKPRLVRALRPRRG